MSQDVNPEMVRELLEGTTEGPWTWRGQTKRDSDMPKDAYLRSEVSPRYIVMDFVRQGMQSAQPRFRHGKPSIMRPISEVGGNWAAHPDARLIAAAPDLARAYLAQAEELGRLREALEWYAEQTRLCRLIHSEGDAGRFALAADGGQRARAALAQQQEGGEG